MSDILPPIEFASLIEVSRRLAGGELRVTELVGLMLERVQRLEPRLHSYARLCAEEAMADAARLDAELDQGRRRGPLHGIPLAIKDLIDIHGQPTLAGTRVLADRYPAQDATVVRKLRQAGAVIIGRAQMTEGATAVHHPDVAVPVNPWNSQRYSGASSSGSGVGVAGGLCYAALGSDTGGSIRIPSAVNGITGVKPTWGRVSRQGVFPYVEYFDTVGPMARSAQDAAAVMAVIAGADPLDPTASPRPVPPYLDLIDDGITDMRIGFDETIFDDCDPDVATAVRHAADVLRQAGTRMCPVRLPAIDMSAIVPLVQAGGADAHRDTYPARADEYGPRLKAMLAAAAQLTGQQVAEAMRYATQLRGQFATLFSEIDLLLLPAVVRVTPEVGYIEQAMLERPHALLHDSRFAGVFNLTGQPTITFRAGTDGNAMPVAAQLVALHFGEALLFRAAHAFQMRTAWHRMFPPSL